MFERVGTLRHLLEQSRDGVHALFGEANIRRALAADFGAIDDHADMLNDLKAIFKRMAALESVSEQRALFHELPDGVQDLVVLLYLRLLDQFIQSQEPTLH